MLLLFSLHQEEDKGVRELIPHTGPIPILIPLKLFLDLLLDPVSPWELRNSQSYVMNFSCVDSWAHSHTLASRPSRIDLRTKWRKRREAALVYIVRFVDEREFKEVSVEDKHRVRKNRQSGFVLEPNCVESSSEDDEVDCSSELEIENDEAETETQGSCSSGEISEDEGSKSKRSSRVTTTNRKSRASTSEPTTRARKAKNKLT